MKRSLPSGMLLLIIGLLACSNSQVAVPDQSLPLAPEPISRPNTAPEPLHKVLRAPEEPGKLRQFSAAPDLDLFRLAKEIARDGGNIPQAVAGDSVEYAVGHTETFWLIDLSDTKTYQSNFTLALVTPHAYWYVEDSLNVSMTELKRSAAHFEKDIYPAVTQVFGTEWAPGINLNRRLNILNARLKNVAGYFSSTDEYPIDVMPKSNQRKIIYINAQDVSPGGADYGLVLSHELQHAIHWNADASEDTWINEGLAELASSIALQSTFSIRQFLRGPPISLVHWPTSSASSLANYGAASLFMHFFTEHYGGRDNLRDLLAEPKDGIAGIDQYLEEQGYQEDFEEVFKQWAAANILDEHLQTGDKIPGYDGLEVRAAVSGSISGLKDRKSEMPQYAVEYTELRSGSEPFQLSFRGNIDVALLPVDVGPSGCWWSNSGDSIDATLSHHIEIPMTLTAALEYEVWFEIEEYWDYVYIEVSVNGGENWQIVETPETSPGNPFGNAFGAGYTGKSGGWLTDSVDLSPFAGEDLWMRFQYVTDDAVNTAGACFRDLSISASGIIDDGDGWEAHGFAFTDNVVRQDFQIQLITVGGEPQARQLPLDFGNSGKWIVQPPGDGERLIVAVGSLAEKTRELASYTLSLTPPK
ncbi:hypothetical protein FIM07_00675 [SAR202 cluster bacterium AD-802-F09_MRT_200m]|nr:hypothetical protein [SAR202 cluster bacterium AD-802-F09_MRT_200m]